MLVPPAIDAKSRAMADELLKKQKGAGPCVGHGQENVIEIPSLKVT